MRHARGDRDARRVGPPFACADRLGGTAAADGAGPALLDSGLRAGRRLWRTSATLQNEVSSAVTRCRDRTQHASFAPPAGRHPPASSVGSGRQTVREAVLLRIRTTVMGAQMRTTRRHPESEQLVRPAGKFSASARYIAHTISILPSRRYHRQIIRPPARPFYGPAQGRAHVRLHLAPARAAIMGGRNSGWCMNR